GLSVGLDRAEQEHRPLEREDAEDERDRDLFEHAEPDAHHALEQERADAGRGRRPQQDGEPVAGVAKEQPLLDRVVSMTDPTEEHEPGKEHERDARGARPRAGEATKDVRKAQGAPIYYRGKVPGPDLRARPPSIAPPGPRFAGGCRSGSVSAALAACCSGACRGRAPGPGRGRRPPG